MSKRKSYLLLGLFGAIITTQLSAFEFIGSLNSEFTNLSVDTNTSLTKFPRIGQAGFRTVEIDETNLTLRHTSIRANFNDFSEQVTDIFPAGLGSSVSITTTLNIDSFSFNFSINENSSLTAASGTIFNIENNLSPSDFSIEEVVITGSYSIEGPTQSFSDTFSLIQDIVITDFELSNNNQLETMLFPDEVELLGSLFFFNIGSKNSLFDGNVDGVNVDLAFGLRQLIFDGPELAAPIPELSQYTSWLALTAAGVSILSRRRVLKRKSGSGS